MPAKGEQWNRAHQALFRAAQAAANGDYTEHYNVAEAWELQFDDINGALPLYKAAAARGSSKALFRLAIAEGNVDKKAALLWKSVDASTGLEDSMPAYMLLLYIKCVRVYSAQLVALVAVFGFVIVYFMV